jgi:hypothetical protein
MLYGLTATAAAAAKAVARLAIERASEYASAIRAMRKLEPDPAWICVTGWVPDSHQPAPQEYVVAWRVDVARGVAQQLTERAAGEVDAYRLVVPEAIRAQPIES